MDRLLTLRQAAAILAVSLTTMRRMVGSGQIKAVCIGRMVRVRESTLCMILRWPRSSTQG